MSMMFTVLKVYECTYCGKLFRTKRHVCKFDPYLGNCFTCTHYAGFQEPEFVEEYHKDVCVCCRVDGNALFLGDLISMKYKLDCDKWEHDTRPLKKRKQGWKP